MRKQNRKPASILSLILISALLLTMISACGKSAESDEAGSASLMESATPAPTAASSTAPTAAPSPSQAAGRQDGERFDSVITIEGMEETVHYEHVKNETLGYEMDYDYEMFQRRSEADRECFVSVYDDPNTPENYLEVKYLSQDAETAAAAISEELSDRYEVGRSTYTLEKAGDCIRLDASVDANDPTRMAQQLQLVSVIPTSDGCFVVTEHYAIEGSEGFGRRFTYFLQSFSPITK